MQTILLIKEALKLKAPALFQSLTKAGKLNEFVQDLADQISSQVVTLTQTQRIKGGWDKLGPMECAARMRTASSLNREIVLAEMLEFPQDGTSPQSPDETTLFQPLT